MCLWNIPPDWTGENWAKGFHCGTAPMGAWISGIFLPTEFHLQLEAQHVYWLTFWIVYELYHTPPVKENGITLKAHQNLSFLPLLILKNRYVYLDEFVCVVHVVGGARAPLYTCGDEGLASGACWLLPPYGMWGSNGDYQVCQKHLRPLSHPIGPVSLILVNGHLSSI